MNGDIFRSANGDIFKRASGCCSAKGNDVFSFNNAVGDISTECVMQLPYPSARMEQLLNMLSVARKEEADAHQERDKAIKDWQECKRKLFCNAAPKNRRLNEKETIWDASKVELERAEAEVKQAVEANELVNKQYADCIEAQGELLSQQTQLQSTLDQAATEKAKVAIEQTKENKGLLVYVLIAAGTISALYFGYKLIK